ncbi:MAG: DUF839 domain-containing protein, partial [Comamonadaceae bacterium]
MTLARREFLQTGAAALVALLGAGCAQSAKTPSALPGFASVPMNRLDTVTVPPGYTAKVMYPWGSPTGMASAMPAFAPDASNSAADQAVQAGMHHDGMHFFPLGTDGRRGLLVMNHEYTDERYLHTQGVAEWSAEKVAKSLHAMGVSVIEVQRGADGWQQVLPSRYARRIHGRTPMHIAGPAAGTPLMRTAANPAGDQVFGTFAN